MTDAPMPSLHFYANDIDDFIRAINERGIHASEIVAVATKLQDLVDENEALQKEVGELQTFRDNSDAEELADLTADLAAAKRKIDDLTIKLHNAMRAKK